MSLPRSKKIFLLVAILLSLTPALVYAWPADSQWLELAQGGAPIQDLEADANGGVNVVPNDGSNPAAYIYNDGSYLYYRIRLDADPTQGGNGVFAQFGWGFEIDTDQNADDYEWLIMCDGISSPEVISLRENTDKTGIGDPSDKAEYVAAEYPLVGNHRLSQIQPGDRDYTAINGDPDYYLDYRLPYGVFKSVTGITDDTLVRYFVGSSRSTNNLTDNGADLVGGSDLYEMGSDYTSPFGTLPAGVSFSDGSVRFSQDIAGFGDMALAAPGDTLFLRVDDADQDSATNPEGTLRVELVSANGDTEVVILNATGVSGKYTGSIDTAAGGASSGDGILQVVDGPVTVTYIDSIAWDLSQSVPRTDTLTITTTQTDVGVSKTVDKPIPAEGATVVFTVTATNYGPNDTTSLDITDTLPVGLTLSTATPGQGSYAGGIWSIGILPRGASADLTLAAIVDVGTSGSTITNTANLTAISPTDGNIGNDSASAVVSVGGTDLRVTKTADTTTPATGSDVTFTVRVFNLGPNDTGGVQVTDLLSGDFLYNSHAVSQGSYDPGSGLWDVGSVNTGFGATLTLTATVTAATGSAISNRAARTASDQPDTDASNDSATIDLLVGALDLVLTKAVDQLAPNSGSPIVYTLTVSNSGPNDATGLAVTDLLPTGVTHTGDDGGGSYDAGSGLWSIGSLAAGASVTLNIDADVDAGTAGQTILNNAAITAVDQPETDTGNNSGSATIMVDGTDLQLTKEVTSPTITPTEGEIVTFTITVTNNGPNDATNLNVTDLLPAGLSYVGNGNNIQVRPSQGSYDKGSGVWSVGDLAVSASATLEIDAKVDTGTSGSNISNVAFITEVDQEDPIGGNNVAEASVSIDGIDLALAKSVDDPTPNVGGTVVYTLTVVNYGTAQATGVVVTDLLPPEVTYLGDDGGTSYDSDPASPTYGQWTVGNIDVGVPRTLNITAEVRNEDNRLVITNSAAITAATQADPVPGNNSARADITVNATDLAVTKSVDNASPAELGAVTYTVTVTNSGANAATAIEVEDILPVGVTLLSATPSQGSYSSGIWFLGSMPAADSATLSILAGVDSGTAGTTITNTATLTAIDQIDENNANDSASIDIVPIIAPDITLVKMVQTYSDPVNGTTTPYSIPGAVMRYTIIATNSGGGAADADSVFVTDPIPAQTDLIVTATPVTFTDGAVSSALSFDPAADVVYYDGADNPVAPSADADGVDAVVRKIVINPKGTLPGSDGTSDPSFSIEFFVRVR